LGLRDVYLFPLGRDHEGSDKSCFSRPMTSKTTIGERGKEERCENQLDNEAEAWLKFALSASIIQQEATAVHSRRCWPGDLEVNVVQHRAADGFSVSKHLPCLHMHAQPQMNGASCRAMGDV
jgi:hypothetical protein